MLWQTLPDEWKNTADDFRTKGAVGTCRDAALDACDMVADASSMECNGAKRVVAGEKGSDIVTVRSTGLSCFDEQLQAELSNGTRIPTVDQSTCIAPVLAPGVPLPEHETAPQGEFAAQLMDDLKKEWQCPVEDFPPKGAAGALKEFETNKEQDSAEESTESSTSALNHWSRQVVQATEFLQAALANLEVTADAFKKEQIQKCNQSGFQADQTPSSNPSVKFEAQVAAAAAAVDAADAGVKAATQMKSRVANLINGRHLQQAQPQVLTSTNMGEDITKKNQAEAFRQLGRKIRDNVQAQRSAQAAAAASALASGLGMPGTMASLPQHSIPLPNFAANGFGMPQAMLQGWPTVFPGMGFEETQTAQAQHTQQNLRLAHALGQGRPQGMMPMAPTVPQPEADVLPLLAAQACARAAATAAAATWQTQNQLATAAIAAAAAAKSHSLKGAMAQAQLAQAAMAAAAGDFDFPSPYGSMKRGAKSGLLQKKKNSQRQAVAGDASRGRSVETKARKYLEQPKDGAKLTQYPLPFTEDTLRSHLQALQDKDPQCVLIVRKINRLGFESPNVLSAHFSRYGQVEHVFVAHSHVRCQNRGKALVARLRPSGLGFLVMALKEDAEQIMQDGDEHTVQGVSIKVHRFEKRADILAEEKKHIEEQD